MKNLPTVLKRYRAMGEMSQLTLAKKIGIKPVTLCRLESGKGVDAETIIKVQHWLFK